MTIWLALCLDDGEPAPLGAYIDLPTLQRHVESCPAVRDAAASGEPVAWRRLAPDKWQLDVLWTTYQAFRLTVEGAA
jgi:hypothetical protein